MKKVSPLFDYALRQNFLLDSLFFSFLSVLRRVEGKALRSESGMSDIFIVVIITLDTLHNFISSLYGALQLSTGSEMHKML